MPASPHTKTYMKMLDEEKKNPKVAIADLCRKYKVKYVNYHGWKKRYLFLQGAGVEASAAKAPKPNTIPRPPTMGQREPGYVTVQIPLREAIEAFKKGQRSITISVDKFLNTMPAADKAALFLKIGEIMATGQHHPDTHENKDHFGDLIEGKTARKGPSGGDGGS